MNKDLFIRDLPIAEKLTPTFCEALEQFLPQWLDSLVPYYEEARTQGVDVFRLADYMPCGASCKLYEKVGIGYYLEDHPYIKQLSFNSDYKYINCYWYECFREFYPRIEDDQSERIDNFIVYNPYMHSPWNLKEDYNCVAKRVDEYFKAITKDPDVTFILSGTSSICLNQRGINWVSYHYKLS